MQEDILSYLVDRLSDEVTKTVKQTLRASVEKEVNKALTRALSDGEFYKNMNTDVQSGLNKIFYEIKKLKQETSKNSGIDNENAEQMLNQTTHELDGIIKQTEEATMQIMDIVEDHLQILQEHKQTLQESFGSQKGEDNPAMDYCEKLNNDLLQILTALSFHDLTSQNIKKIIDLIKRIEIMIGKLYLTQDIMLKEKEMYPDKDNETIQENAKREISQKDIDSLLSKYGLE